MGVSGRRDDDEEATHKREQEEREELEPELDLDREQEQQRELELELELHPLLSARIEGQNMPQPPKTAYDQQCWGCELWLVLPYYAPVIKCGWCGALTINKPKAPRSKWKTPLWKLRDRAFVCLVFSIIVSILCGGVWAAFPVLFPTIGLGLILHTTITFLLSFNTLFNFVVSAVIAPGPPTRRVTWGHVGYVPRASLDGYRFCDLCKWPKPHNAHHCRTCETCVLDMDHHCPFIGNCVGAGNHRHFILFLIYTVIGCLYVLVMGVYTGLRVWPQVIDSNRNQGVRVSLTLSMGVGTLAMLASSILESPRAIALLYLVVAAVSIGGAVAVLLYQQISYLYGGTTFLDSIQEQQQHPPLSQERSGWENLRRIFGNGHPIFWALPILPEASPRKSHVR